MSAFWSGGQHALGWPRRVSQSVNQKNHMEGKSPTLIHFAISHRKTKGSISPYNIARLISEVSEEVATQIGKNCSRQPPHSHLRPPPTGTPASIRIYLVFPETRVIGLHFVAACMGLSSFKFVQWAPKDASFLHRIAFWPFKVVHGHPRSMSLASIESVYTTSY